jgi:protein-disulfide isomerase
MRKTIITSAVAVLALGITGFVAYRSYFPPVVVKAPPPSPIVFMPTKPVAASDDPKMGAENPKHTIIMYADFQCAACSDVAKELPKVLAAHKDTQLVWKDAPNPVLHPWSTAAAAAGRCANQQSKFWEMHDALFAAPLPDEATINGVADSLKLDRTVFDACITADSTMKRINAATILAETYGVNATPYFFIDGKVAGTLNIAADFEPFLK